jgi:putative transposase
MVTPAARLGAVAHLMQDEGMSERRACEATGADRSRTRRKADRLDDADLRTRLRELTQRRRRFCYRRPHVPLCAEGAPVNCKRVQRIHVEEKLHVRKRGGRKRALGTRAPMAVRDTPNARQPPVDRSMTG